jgi:hypothetical protein
MYEPLAEPARELSLHLDRRFGLRRRLAFAALADGSVRVQGSIAHNFRHAGPLWEENLSNECDINSSFDQGPPDRAAPLPTGDARALAAGFGSCARLALFAAHSLRRFRRAAAEPARAADILDSAEVEYLRDVSFLVPK